jgi:hypothetical protein
VSAKAEATPARWLGLLVATQAAAIAMLLLKGATTAAVLANALLLLVSIFVLFRALLALASAEHRRSGIGLAALAIAIELLLVAGWSCALLADLGLRLRATTASEWPAVRAWAREVAAGRASARPAPWSAVDLAERLHHGGVSEAAGRGGARGVDLGLSDHDSGQRCGVVLGDEAFVPVEDPACRYTRWAPGVWGYQRVRM